MHVTYSTDVGHKVNKTAQVVYLKTILLHNNAELYRYYINISHNNSKLMRNTLYISRNNANFRNTFAKKCDLSRKIKRLIFQIIT